MGCCFHAFQQLFNNGNGIPLEMTPHWTQVVVLRSVGFEVYQRGRHPPRRKDKVNIVYDVAGNNHLGGQDFNERLRENLSAEIAAERGGLELDDVEDVQSLRNAVEEAKLALTYQNSTIIELNLRLPVSLSARHAIRKFRRVVSRQLFEQLNEDLFQKVLEPIDRVLDVADLTAFDIDEIVLVGGSTRIPRIRQLIRGYFGGREPNVAIDPELAVVTGISVQAGIVGGMWPLTVSAIEVPTSARKIHLH